MKYKIGDHVKFKQDESEGFLHGIIIGKLHSNIYTVGIIDNYSTAGWLATSILTYNKVNYPYLFSSVSPLIKKYKIKRFWNCELFEMESETLYIRYKKLRKVYEV